MAFGSAWQVLPLLRPPRRVVHQACILRPPGGPLEHLRAWNAAPRAVPLLQPCRVTGRPRGRREARNSHVLPRLGSEPSAKDQGSRVHKRHQLRSVARKPGRTLLQGLSVEGIPLRRRDARCVLPFKGRSHQVRAGAYAVPEQHAAHRPGYRRRHSEGLLLQRRRLAGADSPFNLRPQRGLVQVEGFGTGAGSRTRDRVRGSGASSRAIVARAGHGEGPTAKGSCHLQGKAATPTCSIPLPASRESQ